MVVSEDVLCRANVRDDGDGTVVVSLSGEVDLFSAEVLDAALRTAVEADPPRIVVDMTRLDFIDGSGLHVLLPVARARHEEGRPLVLRAPPPLIWRLVQALGLGRYFLVEHAPRR